MLRSEVGRQTGVRHTPTLAFVADALPEDAQPIEDLLAQARAADAEVRRAAAGARVHAGDADPYRTPTRRADDRDDERRATRGRDRARDARQAGAATGLVVVDKPAG